MGLLSTKITEYKEYHTNDQLKYHYFKKGDIMHGENKCYSNDGILVCESYYNNGFLCKYEKLHDIYGLRKHSVFHDFKDNKYHCTNDPLALCSKYGTDQVCPQHSYALTARYFNNKMYVYSIDIYGTRDSCVCHKIYDVTSDSVYINYIVINSIRAVQKRFRKRIYNKRFIVINYFIEVNDISHIITSYLTTNYILSWSSKS